MNLVYSAMVVTEPQRDELPLFQIGELPYLLTLPACGFYWFRLAADVAVPSWHAERLAAEERPVLVLFDGWTSFFRDRVVPWRIRMAEKLRAQFETETLPRYIATQRWYAAKGVPIKRAALSDWVLWGPDPSSWLIALLQVDAASGQSAYFLPMALAWGDGDDEHVRALAAATVARVRQQSQVGVLADAFADDAFCRANNVAEGSTEYVNCRKNRDVQRGNANARTDRAQRNLAEQMLNNPTRP